MTAKQRTTFSFETASLMLFAALSMGTAAAYAQTGGSSMGAAPRSTARLADSAAAARKAFDRADANQDGMLSPQEAAMLPAVGNRFEQIDTDGDGALSREEFDAGVAQSAQSAQSVQSIQSAQ